VRHAFKRFILDNSQDISTYVERTFTFLFLRHMYI
jgi:hypothetical protein